MVLTGELHISHCLGMASSEDNMPVSHLELGQLSLHCSCSLMLLQEAAIVGDLVRGKTPNSLGT